MTKVVPINLDEGAAATKVQSVVRGNNARANKPSVAERMMSNKGGATKHEAEIVGPGSAQDGHQV